MSTFAAVDLDAVLDDFEDSVNRAKQEEHSPPDKEGAKRPLRGEGEDGSGGEATKVLADPPMESEEEGKIEEVSQSHDLDEEDQVVGRPKVAVGDLISVEDEIGVVPELTGLGIAEESGVEEEAEEEAAAVKGPLEEEIVPGASRQDPPAPPSVDRSASPEFISIYDQAQDPEPVDDITPAAEVQHAAERDQAPAVVSANTVPAQELASAASPLPTSKREEVRGAHQHAAAMAAGTPGARPVDSPPPYSEFDPMMPSAASAVAAREMTSSSEVNGCSNEVEEGPGTSEAAGAAEEQNEVQENLATVPESADIDADGELAAAIAAEEQEAAGEAAVPSEVSAAPGPGQSVLGTVLPEWIPDSEADECMLCGGRFTLVRRRHHCRACGKVFCGACCNEKAKLPCLDNKPARVCKPCKEELDRIEAAASSQDGAIGGAAAAAPSRAGVLKRLSVGSGGGEAAAAGAVGGAAGGSVTSPSSEAKQVMFSDGIRPGGDLAELDGSEERAAAAAAAGGSSSGSSRRRRGRRHHHHSKGSTANVGVSLIPGGEGVFPLVLVSDESGNGMGPTSLASDDISDALVKEGKGLGFQINKNLTVHVKMIRYAPVEEELWSYRSDGLCTVGQDEVVILLSRTECETQPHKELLEHFQHLYEQAKSGCPVVELSYTPPTNPPGQPSCLGGDFGGFLYFRRTFQSVEGLDLLSSKDGEPPPLFGVAIRRWEVPWAKVFPLRLLLRLGAEYRYYPAPLWSSRDRRPVYRDVGNTIMKLLCDFRNFSYSVPLVRGLVIHMEFGLTTIMIPKDQYRQIQKALLNSNEPVLALAASFSPAADSHLVAVQRNLESGDGLLGIGGAGASAGGGGGANASDYETQAINIANKSREVTGASFVVFNGALKASSGLSAKSSIVEDGIMVQVTQERMIEIRKSLERMSDVCVPCGPADRAETSPDERVKVRWVDSNRTVNSGAVSAIDGASLEGVASIRLHSGRDYVDDRNGIFVRWTEVFLLSQSEETSTGGDPPSAGPSLGFLDLPDPMTAATVAARAVASSVVAVAARLRAGQGISKFAVRVNLDPENAHYESGSGGRPLSSFCPEVTNVLDAALVPVIHGPELAGRRLAMELYFHILPC